MDHQAVLGLDCMQYLNHIYYAIRYASILPPQVILAINANTSTIRDLVDEMCGEHENIRLRKVNEHLEVVSTKSKFAKLFGKNKLCTNECHIKIAKVVELSEQIERQLSGYNINDM